MEEESKVRGREMRFSVQIQNAFNVFCLVWATGNTCWVSKCVTYGSSKPSYERDSNVPSVGSSFWSLSAPSMPTPGALLLYGTLQLCKPYPWLSQDLLSSESKSS